VAAAKQITAGLWQISFGWASNAFLLEDDNQLTLIDTGLPGSGGTIVEALRELGREVTDIRRIIVTHCHPDHSGALSVMKRISGAPAMMHPLDAQLVRRGEARRPMSAAPGLRRQLLFRLFVKRAPTKVDAAEIDVELTGDMTVPGTRLRVIHVPGHCAGQIALLWPAPRILFAADAAATMMGLGLSLGYEDLEQGLQSLAILASYEFDIACFGHGPPITSRASERFRQKWAATTV
jgi:glyoxylase-like metal-dependent hydrolase (beta-lactamase superfamily II)